MARLHSWLTIFAVFGVNLFIASIIYVIIAELFLNKDYAHGIGFLIAIIDILFKRSEALQAMITKGGLADLGIWLFAVIVVFALSWKSNWISQLTQRYPSAVNFWALSSALLIILSIIFAPGIFGWSDSGWLSRALFGYFAGIEICSALGLFIWVVSKTASAFSGSLTEG